MCHGLCLRQDLPGPTVESDLIHGIMSVVGPYRLLGVTYCCCPQPFVRCSLRAAQGSRLWPHLCILFFVVQSILIIRVHTFAGPVVSAVAGCVSTGYYRGQQFARRHSYQWGCNCKRCWQRWWSGCSSAAALSNPTARRYAWPRSRPGDDGRWLALETNTVSCSKPASLTLVLYVSWYLLPLTLSSLHD